MMISTLKELLMLKSIFRLAKKMEAINQTIRVCFILVNEYKLFSQGF